MKNFKKIKFFNVIQMALKWPKMIFFAWDRFHSKIQTILKKFSPRNFFHTTISFGCTSAWNIQIFQNLQKFEKKSKNWNFVYITFWALKWPKMIIFAWDRFHSKIQTILKKFNPGNFFHMTISFGCKSAWNFQIFHFFQK